MIDVVREVSAFKPIDLTHIPEVYRPATEQMRTAFILYNKALHEVQLGHDDAAKNYLRKAVTIFPDFYDAVMVLGILVFANGDRIGAVRIFNSVKDVEQRAVSIGILDHLVEEAEKPSSARHMPTGKIHSRTVSSGKAENVMGMASSNTHRVQTGEAKYSKGQVFERSGGYYEPQSRNSNTPARKKYTAPQKNVTREVCESDHRANITSPVKQTESASYHRPDDKSIEDIRTLNKYLLIIIAILLVFSIVISTIIVNRTSQIKDLQEQLNSISASPGTDIGKMPTASPTVSPSANPLADPVGT